MVVHESLSMAGRAGASIDSLSAAPTSPTTSFKAWLVCEWDNILKTANHEPVFDLAVEILKRTPAHPQIERILRQLANAAQAIVSSKALLKHDVSGRIYHRLLLPEVAKGLATFYTSIPAAHLLARLAVETPGSSVKWDPKSDPPVVADLACGSGTLISAAYTAVLDEWTEQELAAGRTLDEPKLLAFHQAMLQESAYGFDVLEYATHLAASWLTLRLPEAEVRHMNVYTLPLGDVGGTTWLGSLSASIRSADVLFPQARSLTGATSGATTAGLTARVAKPVKMPRPDLIIMNPPYARTGNMGKSILMGHLPEKERSEVLGALGLVAQAIKRDLGESFGNAGLGPMFVWLGTKAVRDGGRVAFVLSRALFGGVFWEVARELLTKNFHIEHLVVSYDPSWSWAWSENTDLSEILLVATKGPASGPTRVTYVPHRPRSALEGKVLASRILGLGSSMARRATEDEVLLGGKVAARSFVVDQRRLASYRTWNIPIGWASTYLNAEATGLFDRSEFLGVQLPIQPTSKLIATRLARKGGKMVSVPLIGYDVSPYTRHVRRGGPVSVDALEGANEKTLGHILASPNTTRKVPASDHIFIDSASHLVIAGVGRFWLFTVGVLAVALSRPSVSNTMWTVRLKGKGRADYPVDGYHAQVLWLNSTPGLLGLLALRQDNKGAFVQLKKEYIPLIPLLDYFSISDTARSKLKNTFSKLKNVSAPKLPDQLRDALDGHGFRYDLDSAVLDAIAPGVVPTKLRAVYEQLLSETIIAPGAGP